MGELTHTTALAAANLTLAAFAAAFLLGLAWLLIATVRHHVRTAAARRAFRAAAREAAGIDDGNELRRIDLTSTDLDAELRTLIKENGQ